MSKPGRNDPCSCGSGLKYKKCCLLKESAPPRYVPLPLASNISGFAVTPETRHIFEVANAAMGEEMTGFIRDSQAGSRSEEDALELTARCAFQASHWIMEMAIREQRKPACSDGCDYCCYVTVDATIPELVAAYRGFEKLPDERRSLVATQIDSAYAAIEQLSESERMGQSLPCPFLVEGSCAIYEDRPTPCRGHTSMDASECRQAWEAPGQGFQVSTMRTPFQFRSVTQSTIVDALQKCGLPVYSVELTKGIWTLLHHPEELTHWRTSPKLKAAQSFSRPQL